MKKLIIHYLIYIPLVTVLKWAVIRVERLLER